MSRDATQEPSDEVDERQLELAAAEGEAFREACRYMIEEVAHTGAVTEAGDLTVAIAQEEAEGMYHPDEEAGLEWVEPDEDENCHLEVVVADADDGRFVPELDVTATLVAADGTEVGPVAVPFVWHPGLHHYGTNLSVPGDGSYTVRVEVEPPTFGRHDRENGDRYAAGAEVVFENVDVETGRD
jgi:uncharacterized protein involved in high-affinity Fe2+ transport